MLITGIAPTPQKIHERRNVPSAELVYLAKKALETYGVKRVLTSLEPGWEQALAKAALEKGIPYVVAIPYAGRDECWEKEARQAYLDLLARADEVYRLADCYSETAEMEGQMWRIKNADMTLALWDYDFHSELFTLVDYAVRHECELVNLWQDWHHLYSLRRQRAVAPAANKRRGAQVFDRKN